MPGSVHPYAASSNDDANGFAYPRTLAYGDRITYCYSDAHRVTVSYAFAAFKSHAA